MPSSTPQEIAGSNDLSVVQLLSRERLDGFTVKLGPNKDADLLGRYLYNLAVSQALYPLLHTLEVVLRNRIFDVVSADNPIHPDEPHLYNDYPCWLDADQPLLVPDHRLTVKVAKETVFKDLRRRYGSAQAAARRYRTSGRLVSELPLSFWVFLFDSEYLGEGRESGVLWPKYFDAVFPHRNGQGSPVLVRKRLRRLLVVRNRVMHHERITPYQNHEGVLDVKRTREDTLELIEWMSPRAAQAQITYGEWSETYGMSYQRFMQWVARRV